MAGDKKSSAPLVIIALAIGLILVWGVINRDKRAQLCVTAPCPQPTVSATPFR